MSVTKPTFEEMIARARKGTDDDWTYIDAKFGPDHLTAECVSWSRTQGLIDDNDHVRDFAATVIAKSDVELSEIDRAFLIGPMTQDDHPPVRYWLANALYKRGDRDREVVAVWEEACKQFDPAGEFARSLSNA